MLSLAIPHVNFTEQVENGFSVTTNSGSHFACVQIADSDRPPDTFSSELCCEAA